MARRQASSRLGWARDPEEERERERVREGGAAVAHYALLADP